MEENHPEAGLTLDQAVDRLLKQNLELRGQHAEIDMAAADIEAAGQPPRASLFIDVGLDGIRLRTTRFHELIPRRWADTLVALKAKRVLEALYQDAERLLVDKLYTAFVNLQSAENRAAFAKKTFRGVENLHKRMETFEKARAIEPSALARAKAEREVAAIAAGDAEAELKKSRFVLGNLLNLPDAEVGRLRVSDDPKNITSPAGDPPAADELIRRALHHRPDLRAYRLGVERAQADWLKALVEPLSQITFGPWLERRDRPGPRRAGHAPARGLGFVITEPASIRNRGALKRAEINLKQARTQLAKVEATSSSKSARPDWNTTRHGRPSTAIGAKSYPLPIHSSTIVSDYGREERPI